MKKQLTDYEISVIENKGTEKPFSGLYNDHKGVGTYHCKRCEATLFSSDAKFSSGCGWPSFDAAIEGAIERRGDPDGRRTEILCRACGAHLGHVFEGENLTPKDTRHCVNSVSISFKASTANTSVHCAYFASGCFWGTEYHFGRHPGVIDTRVGYCGGHLMNPSYGEVCRGDSGHLETIEVTYDPKKVSYDKLCQLFFETHDFSQTDGQGPDIGSQYLSAIFYQNESEKKTALVLRDYLQEKGYKVATSLRRFEVFFPAEDYHQKYYESLGETPYCHSYKSIFKR